MSSQIVGEITCVDFIRTRGDTKSINLTLKDSTGTVIPIDGASFTFSVSNEEKPVTANYIFQSIGTITDGPSGKVSFPIDATAADNVGGFFYDVEMILSGGEVCTILKGKFTMNQDITK